MLQHNRCISKTSRTNRIWHALFPALAVILILIFSVVILPVFFLLKIVTAIIAAVVVLLLEKALKLFVRYVYILDIGRLHASCTRRKVPHSRLTRLDVISVNGGLLSIHTISCLADNYAYVIVCRSENDGAGVGQLPTSVLPEKTFQEKTPLFAIVIDASDDEAILDALSTLSLTQYGGRPIIVQAVLTTHHHWDHQAGNRGLTRMFGRELKIYGSCHDSIDGITDYVDDYSKITVGSIEIEVIASPGHTEGSLIYRLVCLASQQDCVFTGDTLFLGGCGGCFEGEHLDMTRSFWRLQSRCTPDALLFPGHEYTCKMLSELLLSQNCPKGASEYFALCSALHRAKHLRSLCPPAPTIPYSLYEEKKYNPNFIPARSLVKKVNRCCKQWLKNTKQVCTPPQVDGSNSILPECEDKLNRVPGFVQCTQHHHDIKTSSIQHDATLDLAESDRLDNITHSDGIIRQVRPLIIKNSSLKQASIARKYPSEPLPHFLVPLDAVAAPDAPKVAQVDVPKEQLFYQVEVPRCSSTQSAAPILSASAMFPGNWVMLDSVPSEDDRTDVTTFHVPNSLLSTSSDAPCDSNITNTNCGELEQVSETALALISAEVTERVPDTRVTIPWISSCTFGNNPFTVVWSEDLQELRQCLRSNQYVTRGVVQRVIDPECLSRSERRRQIHQMPNCSSLLTPSLEEKDNFPKKPRNRGDTTAQKKSDEPSGESVISAEELYRELELVVTYAERQDGCEVRCCNKRWCKSDKGNKEINFTYHYKRKKWWTSKQRRLIFKEDFFALLCGNKDRRGYLTATAIWQALTKLYEQHDRSFSEHYNTGSRQVALPASFVAHQLAAQTRVEENDKTGGGKRLTEEDGDKLAENGQTYNEDKKRNNTFPQDHDVTTCLLCQARPVHILHVRKTDQQEPQQAPAST